MNLIEAIKSGKRFRRKSWTNREFFDVNVSRLDLPVDAIIADDWEVDVPLTRDQFDAIWKKYVDRFDDAEEREAMLKELDRVAKALGL